MTELAALRQALDALSAAAAELHDTIAAELAACRSIPPALDALARRIMPLSLLAPAAPSARRRALAQEREATRLRRELAAVREHAPHVRALS